MKFLRTVFCRHEYETEYLHMIDGGMDKLYKLTCKKCGKERVKCCNVGGR